MSVDPYLHPDMWKCPEFHPTTLFGYVCRPISSLRHVEMARVSPHNIIWRCLWTHFFIQICGNRQSFFTQHHLEMSVDPFLHPDMWKWLEFHPTISFEYVYGPISSSRHVKIARFLFQNIIWRNLWTHFFIQTYRNGQSFTL